MLNFTFQNPVKIIFGKGEIAKVAEEIPKDKRILMTYGGGSIKANGVYDQVMAALSEHTVFEFGGIEPNPEYETLMKAVEMARENNVDYLLSVGGGSIIDGTKFIAAAIPFKGDEWKILSEKAPVESAIPFGVVLTLPATGSEMNSGAVISRRATNDKLVFGSPKTFPQFSILDPETTFSLSPRQTSNGIVDAFIHVMEQYITYPVNSPVQDGFSETLLRTLLIEGPKVLKEPHDYDARANVMLSAAMALNGLISMGVPQDWATHMIGHEMTAKYGIDHGRTLSIILPAMMSVRREEKREKLLQYAENIWHIEEGTSDEKIQMAIDKTREFFESLGIKTRLRDYDLTQESIADILGQLERHNLTSIGERSDIDLEISREILEEAL